MQMDLLPSFVMRDIDKHAWSIARARTGERDGETVIAWLQWDIGPKSQSAGSTWIGDNPSFGSSRSLSQVNGWIVEEPTHVFAVNGPGAPENVIIIGSDGAQMRKIATRAFYAVRNERVVRSDKTDVSLFLAGSYGATHAKPLVVSVDLLPLLGFRCGERAPPQYWAGNIKRIFSVVLGAAVFENVVQGNPKFSPTRPSPNNPVGGGSPTWRMQVTIAERGDTYMSGGPQFLCAMDTEVHV
jgi:hypothetical protein